MYLPIHDVLLYLQMSDVENPGMTVRVDEGVITEWRLYIIMVRSNGP